ncbi:MAG: HEAT repeat domain-containing protein [Chloroflexota bacterium]|nr:HEAT repeat domain-containing protein [Chloroflexota bacterium]
MTDEQTFALALDTLRAGEPLSNELLTALSHLERGELAAFGQVWSRLEPDRRLELLGRLTASERANLRQDFNAIYGLALADPDPAVRRAAVESVVEDEGARLLARLIDLASNDPDSDVRRAALTCLAPFALRAELGEIGDEWRPSLERCLLAVVRAAGADIAQRREALASLGYLDSDAVAEEIRRAFADPELRQVAVKAMGRTANPGWLPLLRQEARAKDVELRREVAVAAGEVADQRASKFVVDMLDDPSLDVRLAAIAALGQIGGDEARDGLIYALEDKRDAVREAAQEALSTLESDEDPLAL